MMKVNALLEKIEWWRVSRWALRAGLVASMLFVVGARPAYVTIGPVQEVQTEHPVLCVHTRLTDEVEEWKIQRTLQMVREMGATRVVEFFPWAYIETAPGDYHWQHFDTIVAHAQAQGLSITARLGLVPGWAQPEGSSKEATANTLTPEYFDEFAAFVEAFTAHYAGQVDSVIIWNEPNLAFEWGFQQVDPQTYVDLLSKAYPAAKRGNPQVTVLAGALAPTLEPVGSPHGMNEIDYLQGLYNAGFSAYYDALAIHTYGFKFPPEEPPAPDVLNFRRAELLREIMVANGDSEKAVYITESGWNDHPRWTKAVRPGQRITYTLGALEHVEDNWGWAEAACIWAMRYPAPTHSYPDYFTLISADFTPKPIYEALQTWARNDARELP